MSHGVLPALIRSAEELVIFHKVFVNLCQGEFLIRRAEDSCCYKRNVRVWRLGLICPPAGLSGLQQSLRHLSVVFYLRIIANTSLRGSSPPCIRSFAPGAMTKRIRPLVYSSVTIHK